MPLAVGLWNQTRYQKEVTVLIPNRAKQHVPCFRLPSATYPKSAFAIKSSILIAFNLIQISAAWLVLIAHCRSETLFRVSRAAADDFGQVLASVRTLESKLLS